MDFAKELFEGAMATFIEVCFFLSLSYSYLQQHLYQLGEPRRLLQKLEQQEQELEQRRTKEVQQGLEEINDFITLSIGGNIFA